MRGGKLFLLLLSICLLAILMGVFFPILFERLFNVEEQIARQRSEAVVTQAAEWYLITHGPPNYTLRTNEVKKRLVPHYLTQWPEEEEIQCEINPNGDIKVKIFDKHVSRWKDRKS